MSSAKNRDEEVDGLTVQKSHYGTDWNEIPMPSLPRDSVEWHVAAIVLVLIGLTGLVLFAVAELHRDESTNETPPAAVRAEASEQIEQDSHVASLLREHRQALMISETRGDHGTDPTLSAAAAEGLVR